MKLKLFSRASLIDSVPAFSCSSLIWKYPCPQRFLQTFLLLFFPRLFASLCETPGHHILCLLKIHIGIYIHTYIIWNNLCHLAWLCSHKEPWAGQQNSQSEVKETSLPVVSKWSPWVWRIIQAFAVALCWLPFWTIDEDTAHVKQMIGEIKLDLTSSSSTNSHHISRCYGSCQGRRKISNQEPYSVVKPSKYNND